MLARDAHYASVTRNAQAITGGNRCVAVVCPAPRLPRRCCSPRWAAAIRRQYKNASHPELRRRRIQERPGAVPQAELQGRHESRAMTTRSEVQVDEDKARSCMTRTRLAGRQSITQQEGTTMSSSLAITRRHRCRHARGPSSGAASDAPRSLLSDRAHHRRGGDRKLRRQELCRVGRGRRSRRRGDRGNARRQRRPAHDGERAPQGLHRAAASARRPRRTRSATPTTIRWSTSR